jgi:hypothetical protein
VAKTDPLDVTRAAQWAETVDAVLTRYGRLDILASDESAYVSGSELVIDGGVTAR